MASKNFQTVNPLQPPLLDVDHTPLVDKDFKIIDTVTNNNLLELHCWSHENFADQADDLNLWNSNLPKYIVPQTHQSLEVIRLCQFSYFPDERAIVTSDQEILITITT